jgi:hypothetical protein
MKWFRSARDLARDMIAALLIELGALIDEWRAER